jgi:hypothetical protein
MSGPSCLIVRWAHRGWKAGFSTQRESRFLANRPGSLLVGEVVHGTQTRDMGNQLGGVLCLFVVVVFVFVFVLLKRKAFRALP